MNKVDKWDVRFLKLAREVSTWSKDPAKKIGAVIVNDDRLVLSTGYNGFPKGIRDTERRLNNRDLKLELVVHAEMNAIYNATRNGIALNDATLYCWGLPICSRCALGIISAGVKRVVMIQTEESALSVRWSNEAAMAISYFDECGIETAFIDINKFK